MARELLNSILDYVYGEAQGAATATERDGYTLALALIGAVRRSSPNPFLEACYYAFGCTLERHLTRREERRRFYHEEFLRAIPDYDPTEARRVSDSQPRRTSRLDLETGSRFDAILVSEPRGNEPGSDQLDGTKRETAHDCDDLEGGEGSRCKASRASGSR